MWKFMLMFMFMFVIRLVNTADNDEQLRVVLAQIFVRAGDDLAVLLGYELVLHCPHESLDGVVPRMVVRQCVFGWLY
jgi:hypothetical protein